MIYTAIMVIRSIELEDLDSFIILLRKLGFRRLESIPLGQLKEKTVKLMSRNDDRVSTYVAEMDNRLTGFVSVHWLPYFIFGGQEGYISELFILEEYRGQGIGTGLMKVVEEEGKRRDCIRLNLLNSEERESYQRQFYTKLGYYERTEFKNFVKSLQ